MALTAEQQEARKGKLTGSAIGILMEGNEEKILNLYYELTGDPRYEKENLDRVWPVQLGSATEEVNLNFYEYKTGNPITRRGEVAVHPQHNWASVTLDGWDSVKGIPIECKHCGNFRKIPDVIKKYAPQLHWQMFVTNTREITLSVIIGGNEPLLVPVEWDEFYWSTLWDRAQKFWQSVASKAAPSITTAAPVAKAAEVIVMRTVNLIQMRQEGELPPNWVPEIEMHLDVWVETVNAMKLNDGATVKIKELLPSDVGHLIYEGVQIKRSKIGAVTITKDKE